MTSFSRLEEEASTLGKPEWRAMLRYAAELHENAVHDAKPPLLPYPWEEIGPGCCGSPTFGNWDIVHQILDTMPSQPEHAREQILNLLSTQQADGMFPGYIRQTDECFEFNTTLTCPPVWVFAVEDYLDIDQDVEFLSMCCDALKRQISWFERKRRSADGGFFCMDAVSRTWESGVEGSVRFDGIDPGERACVDATSHVYYLYATAARWVEMLGEYGFSFEDKASELRSFIRKKLYDEEIGLFADIWAVGNPELRRLTFEGIWPVVVGAASESQAHMVIDGSILNPERFFTPHPISTVGRHDPGFGRRTWRGPALNSMTNWAARGCLLYGRDVAARTILEAALDDTARQFRETGTVWEFYDPLGGNPEEMQEEQTNSGRPCRDYLGHNPLFAMARTWESAGGMSAS